jgi:hypothetical protein
MLGESAPLHHEELFSDQFFLFFGEEARWLCETWKLMKIAVKLVHQHLSLSQGRARVSSVFCGLNALSRVKTVVFSVFTVSSAV